MSIPPGEGVVWLDAPPFPQAAREALGNSQLRANLGRPPATIRDKRLRVTAELTDWEELRTAAAAIKAEVAACLDSYLVQLEESVTRAGGGGHRGRDAGGGKADNGGLG